MGSEEDNSRPGVYIGKPTGKWEVTRSALVNASGEEVTAKSENSGEPPRFQDVSVSTDHYDSEAAAQRVADKLKKENPGVGYGVRQLFS